MVEVIGCCSWPRATNAGPAYLGKNLLVADISNGLEPVKVPCTNDVDRDPPPFLNEYMTKSRLVFLPVSTPVGLLSDAISSAIFRIMMVVELLWYQMSLSEASLSAVLTIFNFVLCVHWWQISGAAIGQQNLLTPTYE